VTFGTDVWSARLCALSVTVFVDVGVDEADVVVDGGGINGEPVA
jgi:hypothetical protein